MSVEQMRGIISSVYKTKSWQDKVKKMPDGQIIAIYKRFLADGKLK